MPIPKSRAHKPDTSLGRPSSARVAASRNTSQAGITRRRTHPAVRAARQSRASAGLVRNTRCPSDVREVVFSACPSVGSPRIRPRHGGSQGK